ncbi:response regulator [Methylorubrum extorquens]|uniref:Putative response regulator receiver n=1 Tax=Methylorubrum extorquens TaxID=408 RepID=A0A2N9AXM0_METEX|nr:MULTISPECIES: response regulator [Methylobacteriaceae]KQP88957.1 response regulator receiver protein [Methylobacterium sp. Leaf119]ABY29183.1 response regulator receiver [Methylorubrum extorquens PA1]KQQ08983.1 response regulator receiver protein [Methylobacterium sp. Leaf122]WIU40526.1 response regulator [Methylorubrum extorquens]SOR32062.1 putative response regulator receiver [Methylorubrum extorquens]
MSDLDQVLVGHRVLVVEDEYLIALLMTEWLEAAGADVVGPAPTVEKALALIESDVVDAAILDVNLGHGRTVYLVADKLSVIGVPYMFATGDVMMAIADAYKHQPRVEKPFSETAFICALKKLTTSPSQLPVTVSPIAAACREEAHEVVQ